MGHNFQSPALERYCQSRDKNTDPVGITLGTNIQYIWIGPGQLAIISARQIVKAYDLKKYQDVAVDQDVCIRDFRIIVTKFRAELSARKIVKCSPLAPQTGLADKHTASTSNSKPLGGVLRGLIRSNDWTFIKTEDERVCRCFVCLYVRLYIWLRINKQLKGLFASIRHTRPNSTTSQTSSSWSS